MAETGSPPKEIGPSVRPSVRHDGGDWKNGYVEGDSRSSSSSVRHLLGKAGSLEENGSGDLFEGLDITPQAGPPEQSKATRDSRAKEPPEETAGGAT